MIESINGDHEQSEDEMWDELLCVFYQVEENFNKFWDHRCAGLPWMVLFGLGACMMAVSAFWIVDQNTALVELMHLSTFHVRVFVAAGFVLTVSALMLATLT